MSQRCRLMDNELRKMSRAELLELLLVQSKEIDRLNAQLEQLQDQMTQRKIGLAHAGNIAEASLQLSGIFEAAQAAADQYLENIKVPVAETEERCCRMLEQTQQQCDDLLRNTRMNARRIWEVIRREMYNPKLDYEQWQEIAEYIEQQLKIE